MTVDNLYYVPNIIVYICRVKHSGDNICNKFQALYLNASPEGLRDRLPIPNYQFPIPNYQFPIPNSQLSIPNYQFPIPKSQI
ncbi:MAG: hypothetical protein HC786_26310 [Richelia sp. CSU_2_1]|nr:hypothetical protein [Richelia sp. CSU_2_1]